MRQARRQEDQTGINPTMLSHLLHSLAKTLSNSHNLHPILDRRLSKCSHKKLPELMTRAFLNTLPPILTSVCAACQIDFKAQLHLNVFRLSSCIEVDGLAWEVLSVQTPTSNTHTHNLLFPMSMSQCPLPNSQYPILNSQCPMTKSQCQIPNNQFPMTSPH